jgi:predicted nucleotidyltransferase
VPSDSLRTLARHLDIPERTLRRAAAEGLVRGRRISARRYETSLREEAYLRRQWPLLRELRDALRTEPNVRLAVLFGSQAPGRGTERSDIDLLVVLADASAARVAQITGRLERRLGRDVQLVRLQDAERTPSLMADALEQGRVLVDRDGQWPDLKAREATWRRRAASSDVALEHAMPDLELR